MKQALLMQLEHLLEAEPFKDNLMTVEQIHGFLCAIISNPVIVPIKTWLPAIYGNDPKLMAHESAANINQLVTDMHKHIEIAFESDHEIEPLLFAQGDIIAINDASNEQLASWCAGYMAGVSANQQTWLASGHQDIYGLLTPISAFAQFFDGNQPKDGSATEIDPQAIHSQYLSLLPATITNIYHFWRQHQHCNHVHHHHPETFRHEGPKAGRNDPCICGSGKKFKKCCGI